MNIEVFDDLKLNAIEVTFRSETVAEAASLGELYSQLKDLGCNYVGHSETDIMMHHTQKVLFRFPKKSKNAWSG